MTLAFGTKSQSEEKPCQFRLLEAFRQCHPSHFITVQRQGRIAGLRARIAAFFGMATVPEVASMIEGKNAKSDFACSSQFFEP